MAPIKAFLKKEIPTMRTKSFRVVTVVLLAAAFLCAAPAIAQTPEKAGKLKVHVHPKQAYVFVDGKAIRDGNQTIDLPAGAHAVGVYNYGYTPKTQDVAVKAGEETTIDVSLQSSGDKVSGPFADIEFKGHPRAAVLLNGTTPDYFVGHVDEFDWDWIWHQRLLVKPGTYQVTVEREGNTIWSGQVAVKAGQKVIVNLNDGGRIKMMDWKEGNTLGPQPRFHAGVASAMVPIAPVTGALSAKSTQIGCGQSTDLDWKSADAVNTSISNIGSVPPAGERAVSPTKTTTYALTAKGPGGEYTKSVTVDVNALPVASLSLSQPEVRYHKIGDKVVQQGSTILKWTASNANSVVVQPIGRAATSGSRAIEATPKQTSTGPVNEKVDYTLTAANACGGTTTRTATLHVVGSIDPAPAVTLASMFFPTAYPTARHPKIGLVSSEQRTLAKVAANFKNHEQYEGKANLMVVGHADVRRSKLYNQALSERRAAVVKSYLVAHGVPADRIKVRAEGKEQQLDRQQVERLQAQDAQKPEKWMMHRARATWLAYNRRVDIVLEPEGQQSSVAYPNDVAEARILWQRREPGLKTVNMASKAPSVSFQQARASNSGN
jgi:OmpA family protein/PEGA domain-containing protein